MRIKVTIMVLMVLATLRSFAQQPAATSKEACLNRLETLFEEGRHSYVDIGNKVQLQKTIEAYRETLAQGRKSGWITPDDEEQYLLTVKLDKMEGDYHYLNSDADRSSFSQAESYFRNALSVAAATQSPSSYYYQFVIREELAQLYYKQGRYAEALSQMLEAERYSTYLDDDEEILDFISQKAMCQARVGQFKDAVDAINMVLGNYPDKKSEPYGEALRKKAKMLMLQKEHGGTGMADPTDEALKCYKEYFALKKTDALQRLGDMSPEDREQYWMRIRPFMVDCYRTEDADPAFLYDVTLFGKSLLLEYARSGKPRVVTWEQVQRQLKPTDCALEFVQYEKQGKKQMGALVLRKTGRPVFVKIGSLEALQNIPLKEGGTLYGAVSTDCGSLKNNLYGDSTIFQQIWTPALLEAIGKQTQQLYFAADGLFQELAIEYMLPDMPSRTALKTENLYRLTSTRQLLVTDNKTSQQRSGELLLCGGIDFFEQATAASEGKEADFANDNQAYQNLRALDCWFSNLPGTEAEIEGILAEYDNTRVTMLTDRHATETRAAYLIGQYPVVHLATHGFYLGSLPGGTDLKPASYDESLSQSGIVFAGVTSTLTDDGFSEGQHDGVLSSREITLMDYSNVRLVVLSACQTAQGYMTDDGVYGLQRGLKNAGVKAMILSLWSVDDDATSLLMQAFYRYMMTEDVHAAFNHARQDLVNTRREQSEAFDPILMTMQPTEPDFSAPCYSNAFIMIDVK